MDRKVEIWRIARAGKIRGSKVFWDEDWYRVSKPHYVKKLFPRLDKNGVQVRDRWNGLVVDERDVVETDSSGKEIYDVLVESLVNDSFIQHNKEAYAEFINEHGERRDDRYKSNN
jgi:hypothetical protein